MRPASIERLRRVPPLGLVSRSGSMLFISHKVCFKSFCKVQFPHKFFT